MKLSKTLVIIITVVLFDILANDVNAATVQCGDIITEDITLTEDLNCQTDQTALHVINSDVTIDLNGHTISGTTGHGIGISIIKSKNVEIINGAILELGVAINAVLSDRLIIENMEFTQVGAANVIKSSDNVVISNNTYYDLTDGIDLLGKGNHLIKNNKFIGLSQEAIELRFSSGNIISNNKLSDIYFTGIRLFGTMETNIIGNTLTDMGFTSIQLENSPNNVVKNNYLDSGNKGISINARYFSDESLRDRGGFKNFIINNSIYNYDVAVKLGVDNGTIDVHSNYINMNKIYYNELGISFHATTYDNNAKYNAYHDNTNNVIDNGTGNIY